MSAYSRCRGPSFQLVVPRQIAPIGAELQSPGLAGFAGLPWVDIYRLRINPERGMALG